MTKKILIVDDETHARMALNNVLEEYGYETVAAANGKEAIDKARKEKPDVVLLDTRLPDMDGNKVCRQIKKIKGLAVKVVVYTGYVDAVDAGKARAAGADDYVVKTLDLSYLLEAIKKFV